MPPGQTDPLAAVSDLISVLEAEPLVTDTPERRRGSYLRQLHRQLATAENRYRYCVNVLLPSTVERCRDLFRRRWGDWRLASDAPGDGGQQEPGPGLPGRQRARGSTRPAVPAVAHP